MERDQIRDLVERYHTQSLSDAEMKKLESLIEEGSVALSALEPIAALDNKIERLRFPDPTPELDDRFYQMLALQKKKARGANSWKEFFSWPQLAPRLAFASVALLAGIGIGYLMRSPVTQSSGDLVALREQVSDLKEMMMLSMIEKESPTERLKAVSLTQEMNGVSSKVTEALIKTLNQDENVNVRLAALEALVPYVGDSEVRKQLIRSITMQESPLVQVALAELMASIQEKASVRELQKIIQSEKTPNDVKNRIRQSIKVLS